MDMARGNERWQAIGAEIKDARIAKGYVGKDIERLTEGRVTQNRFSKAERAEREFIPYEELAEIARVLDMDLDVLALMAYGRQAPDTYRKHA